MAKLKAKLLKVMGRDGGVCGLHLGGCGRKIERGKASVDHIIPKSYMKTMPASRRTEYGGLWNLQPMCSKCNIGKKGQIWGWPLFQCTCHWLQLADNGGMYVWEVRKRGSLPRKHLFRDDAISAGNGVVYTGNIGANSYVDKNGVKWRGMGIHFVKNDGSSIPLEMGHMMPRIPRFRLTAFNWFERARVKRAKSPLTFVLFDDGLYKNYKYLPNGNVFGDQDYRFASRFDLRQGHNNIYKDNDPFASGRKVWVKLDPHEIDSEGLPKSAYGKAYRCGRMA